MNNKEANFWPVKAIRVHPVGMTPVSVNGSLRELLSLPATPPRELRLAWIMTDSATVGMPPCVMYGNTPTQFCRALIV